MLTSLRHSVQKCAQRPSVILLFALTVAALNSVESPIIYQHMHDFGSVLMAKGWPLPSTVRWSAELKRQFGFSHPLGLHSSVHTNRSIFIGNLLFGMAIVLINAFAAVPSGAMCRFRLRSALLFLFGVPLVFCVLFVQRRMQGASFGMLSYGYPFAFLFVNADPSDDDSVIYLSLWNCLGDVMFIAILLSTCVSMSNIVRSLWKGLAADDDSYTRRCVVCVATSCIVVAIIICISYNCIGKWLRYSRAESIVISDWERSSFWRFGVVTSPLSRQGVFGTVDCRDSDADSQLELLGTLGSPILLTLKNYSASSKASLRKAAWNERLVYLRLESCDVGIEGSKAIAMYPCLMSIDIVSPELTKVVVTTMLESDSILSLTVTESAMSTDDLESLREEHTRCLVEY